MPYAQQHYPFENKELFEAGFPGETWAVGGRVGWGGVGWGGVACGCVLRKLLQVLLWRLTHLPSSGSCPPPQQCLMFASPSSRANPPTVTSPSLCRSPNRAPAAVCRPASLQGLQPAGCAAEGLDQTP